MASSKHRDLGDVRVPRGGGTVRIVVLRDRRVWNVKVTWTDPRGGGETVVRVELR